MSDTLTGESVELLQQRLHRVERECGVVPCLMAGADTQHGQPEQPVQQPRVRRHRANPVARHRKNLALKHARAQLHLL